MRIAIIGTGNVGAALAGSLASAGHDVTVAGRGEAKAAALATTAGVTAAPVRDAVRGTDVVILAVPWSSAAGVAADIRDVVGGAVVVDATNPLTADYTGLVTAGGPSAAERLAEILPGIPVVKAFNTLFASIQADPGTHGVQLDGLYATDDAEAGDRVAEILASIGLRPVHVGPLAAARELEALAWLNISLQLRSGGDWRTAYRLVGAPSAAVRIPVAA